MFKTAHENKRSHTLSDSSVASSIVERMTRKTTKPFVWLIFFVQRKKSLSTNRQKRNNHQKRMRFVCCCRFFVCGFGRCCYCLWFNLCARLVKQQASQSSVSDEERKKNTQNKTATKCMQKEFQNDNCVIVVTRSLVHHYFLFVRFTRTHSDYCCKCYCCCWCCCCGWLSQKNFQIEESFPSICQFQSEEYVADSWMLFWFTVTINETKKEKNALLFQKTSTNHTRKQIDTNSSSIDSIENIRMEIMMVGWWTKRIIKLKTLSSSLTVHCTHTLVYLSRFVFLFSSFSNFYFNLYFAFCWIFFSLLMKYTKLHNTTIKCTCV